MAKTYATSDAIDARIGALAAAHSSVCTVQQAGQSVNARPIRYLRIKASAAPKVPVLVISGVHADELSAPETLLDFVDKLLTAYDTKTTVTYPAMTVSGQTLQPYIIGPADVGRILEQLDLYVLPLANPDGRVHVLSDGVSPWRKNQAAGPACTDPAPADQKSWGTGTNLNRNFDIAWDPHFYGADWLQPAPLSPGISRVHIEENPCNSEYHGVSAASEPETRAIQQLIDSVPFRYFLDLHNGSGEVLYPWSFAPTQTTDPKQSFLDRGLDRIDGDTAHPGRSLQYQEYCPPGTYRHLVQLAQTMRDETNSAMSTDDFRASEACTGNTEAYSGTSMDYAFSRFFINEPAPGPVTRPVTYAYSVELGFTTFDSMAPVDDNQYAQLARALGVLLREFLHDATHTCVIATAAAGSALDPDIEVMRRLRDEVVRPTRLGARVLDTVEPPYYRYGDPIARALESRPRARALVRRLVVRPLATAARLTYRLFRTS
jgi:hypothetical protein